MAALLNVRSVEAVDAEMKRRAVVGIGWCHFVRLSPTTSPAPGDMQGSASTVAGVRH